MHQLGNKTNREKLKVKSKRYLLPEDYFMASVLNCINTILSQNSDKKEDGENEGI